MTAANDILKTIPTIQAAGLVDYNLKKLKKKNKKPRDFVEQGFGNILGASFIDVTSDFI